MDNRSLPAFPLLVAVICFVLGLTGCTGLFFHPSPTRYPLLETDRLTAETATLESKDGTQISAWTISSVQGRRTHPEIATPKDLKPEMVRGIALQFHGNAQNMSAHYRFQTWLLFEGWDVLTFDYRGYGSSQGDPGNLRGVWEDGVAALRWADKVATERKLPLVVFGQSLGSNILLRALGEFSPQSLKLVVIDSGFYSFTSIAREKLSEVWFLWPFQWLGWLLVSNEISAGPWLEKNPERYQTPAVFLHSVDDPVVSNSQGEKLYGAYPGPKVRWTTDVRGHVNTLNTQRDKMKQRLKEIEKTP